MDSVYAQIIMSQSYVENIPNLVKQVQQVGGDKSWVLFLQMTDFSQDDIEMISRSFYYQFSSVYAIPIDQCFDLITSKLKKNMLTEGRIKSPREYA